VTWRACTGEVCVSRQSPRHSPCLEKCKCLGGCNSADNISYYMNRNQREEETAARQPNFDTLFVSSVATKKISRNVVVFFFICLALVVICKETGRGGFEKDRSTTKRAGKQDPARLLTQPVSYNSSERASRLCLCLNTSASSAWRPIPNKP